MRLLDMYEDDEIPTRPDHPATVARRCKHCGRVFGDHAQTAQPQSAAPCRGIRKGYDPEEHSDGDRER